MTTTERTISWSVGLGPAGPGVVLVTERRGRQETTDAYVVSAVPTQLGGEGYAFKRVTPHKGEAEPLPTYHLLVGPGEARTCECLGFLRYGYCRHLEAVASLPGGRLNVR